MNTSVISDGIKTYLSTHGLGNIYLIACVRLVRDVCRALKTSMIVLMEKIATLS